MPFEIVRNDITQMQVDAIVNAAKNSLLGGGGVDGAIHRAAGPELLAECRKLNGCQTGCAKITGGYRLPAKYVIHTVGPVYQDGSHGEEELLISCYRSALFLAWENHCESVAFPLISAGAYGYPKQQAYEIACRTITQFLSLYEDMRVYLVIFDRTVTEIALARHPDLKQYIDDADERVTAALMEKRGRRGFYRKTKEPCAMPFREELPDDCASLPLPCAGSSCVQESVSLFTEKSQSDRQQKPDDFDRIFGEQDESFSQMLLRKIDEKGMKDAECYKKANIDRKLFSKIRSHPQYRPSKSTAVAFCIALELDLWETQEMLAKAGYTLSDSFRFDLIVKYFIQRKQYNIFEINESLFAYDQPLLGA